MKKYKNKKKSKLFLLIILVLGISVGFALLSSTLNIVGIGGIKNGTWDIHWKDDSVEVSSGSVTSATPVVSGTNDDTVTFSTTLELPGDYFEFTVDAINEGSVDGMIDEINTTVTDSNGDPVEFEDYINFSVTYNDGTPIRVNQILGAGQREKYKLRLEFDSNSEEVPEEDITYNVSYQVTYIQPDENKIMPVRYAEFDTGENVNIKIKSLAGDDVSGSYPYSTIDNNIISFERTTTAPNISQMTDDNIISSSTSKVPIYAWLDNGVIKYYCEDEDVYLNEDASGMFYAFKSITNIDTSYNTKNTKYMAGMFGNTTINTLDLSNFNTGNVTSMAGMFAGAQIPTLNVSSFNTSNVTNMGGMFAGCQTNALDLSNFDVSHVTAFGMFGGCGAKTIDISNWNFASVTSLSNFFSGCSVENLILKNVNTSTITNLNSFVGGAGYLKSLDMSSFDVSHVTDFNIFGANSQLKSVNISGWNFASVTSLYGMFNSGLTSLESINMTGVNTSTIENMGRMFCGCTKLKKLNLTSFDTHNVTNMVEMFCGCTSLETIIVSDDFVVDGVTNSNSMFAACSSLVGGNGTLWNSDYIDKTRAHYDYGTTNPGYFNKANVNFYTVSLNPNGGTVSPVTVEVVQGEPIGNLPIPTLAGHACTGWYTDLQTGIKVDSTYIPTGNITLTARWERIDAEFDTGKNVNIKLKALAGDDVSGNNPWFNADTNVTAIRRATTAPDTSTMTNDNIISSANSSVPIYAWFDNGTIYYWSSANKEYTNEDASYMFCNFASATSIDTSFSTTQTINMSYMFEQCRSLTSIDVSDFDVSHVTNMYCMLYYTESLQKLDISSWDLSSKPNMDNLIGNSSIKELDMSNLDISYCPGAKFMLNYIATGSDHIERIKLDNAKLPSSMSQAFIDLEDLEEISFKNADFSKVTTMYGMLQDCYSLTKVDFTGINTKNVTNMQYLFWHCRSLETVDLSPLNTSSVTDLSYMFQGCSKLKSIDLSTFDTHNVTNWKFIIEDCKKLKTINFSNLDFSSYTSSDGFGYNITGGSLNNEEVDKLILDNAILPSGTNMYNGFVGFHGLKELSLKNVDTSHVTTFQYMFQDMDGLTTLDISSFDTTNVTYAQGMFDNMDNIETIYASNSFDLTNADGDYLFNGDTKLVGGAGTVYDSNHTGRDYARIDASGTPGYFTLKTNLNNNLGSSFVNAARKIFKIED